MSGPPEPVEVRGRDPAEVPVSFAIAGCGGMGKWHAKVLSALPDTRVVAAADPDRAAREAVASSSGVPVFASLDELLASVEAEVVTVCTPPAAHLGAVLEAAEAGRHVLVEKPFALTVEEADRAMRACEEAGVRLSVVHQQRGRSACRAVHRLLARGHLGAPRLAVVTHSWFRPGGETTAGPWRADPAAGGGVLLDQAVHAIDLLLWLLGTPRWVSGSAGAGPVTQEDTAVALLGFDEGVLATLAASTVSNAMRDDIVLEVFGSLGSVRLEVRDYDNAEIAWLDLSSKEGERARRLPRGAVEGLIRAEEGAWRSGPRARRWRALEPLAGRERGVRPFRSARAFLRRRLDRAAQAETGEAQGHAAVFRAMAATVRGRGEPLVGAEEARDGLAVVEALRRSHAAAGARIGIGAA